MARAVRTELHRVDLGVVTSRAAPDYSARVAETGEALAQGAGNWAAKPRQHIMTLYGLYAARSTFWLPVSAIVRLLGDLDIDQRTVRAAIFRLKANDVLIQESADGVAGYKLAPGYAPRVSAGDQRIFGQQRGMLEDGWILIGFSIPESMRDKRHQLRAQLTNLGYGTVSPGLWIAPAHLHDDTVAMLDQFDLDRYAEIFHSDYRGRHDLKTRITEWWNLDQLRDMYAEFIERHRPTHRSGLGPATERERTAFIRYVPMVSEWRRLPYADPGLPLELLGKDWIGLRAQRLFDQIHTKLSDPARGYAETAIAG